jgi:hypothetical protein
MESRSGHALVDEELDILAQGWVIVIPIGRPCDVMVEREYDLA